MHLKQKLTFMALGSILTIAGYLLATLTSDVTAQSETDKQEKPRRPLLLMKSSVES